MFAIRLADRLGFLSVDNMLAAMTPEQFNERFAAHHVDPGNDSWESVATLAAILHNIAAGFAGSDKLKDVEDFMPGPNRKRAMSPEAFESLARARYG